MENKKSHLAVVVGCIFYSMNGLLIANVHDMAIYSIIFYRFFFGLLFLFIYIAVRGKIIAVNGKIIAVNGKISDLRLKKKKGIFLLQGVLCYLHKRRSPKAHLKEASHEAYRKIYCEK